jgi:cell wall assembly regulator SMI1
MKGVSVMRDIWQRVEKWLRVNAPQVLGTLQSGASEEEIRRTEKFLSVEFPDDVKDSYRIHNGQSRGNVGFINGIEFLSLARVRDEWMNWKDLLDSGIFEGWESEPENKVKADWWNPKWIPLTSDWGGNHECLDLAPTEEGDVGQIISMWHDDAERQVKAGSFRGWLEQFANDLEAGRDAPSEEDDGIVNIDDV